MQVRFVAALQTVEAQQWNRMAVGIPCLQHAFLTALETSACVTKETGWQPWHALVEDAGEVVAAMPLYIKGHSQGEHVFDQQWAEAYDRHDVDYYPKLLTAIPFTPAQGPRLLGDAKLASTIIETVKQQVSTLGLSSWHVLFAEQQEAAHWHSAGFLHRQDCQYHWFNRGYDSFEHYLSFFTAKKRKNLKRERRRVTEQAISIERLSGDAIEEQHWRCFYPLYADTYLKRGRRPYLNQDLFKQWCTQLRDQLLLVLAYHNGVAMAGALYLFDDKTLYGRYWGAHYDVDSLHFECCYYQGIEFCIENGLQRFDPGAQGEHKIARGFEPVLTDSYHWIESKPFRTAIADYVQHERQAVAEYQQAARQQLPFKNGFDQ